MATILHVDMDAFFASIEQVRHPEWRGKPVIVGAGPHERGVVSTCSYEARRFGVHSAMPSRTAYERCPTAIFTPPDMAHYHAVSERVFEVFSHFSPFVEAVSVDEAFLDISGTLHLHAERGDTPLTAATRLGEALRREVRAASGVTCSVGIAPNRLLAKLGSEAKKPDGLTVMPFEPAAIAAYLAPRPLGVLWGVGEKTAAALRPYGLVTCGDVQRLKAEKLAALVGSAAAAAALQAASRGEGEEFVYYEAAAEKSVSREFTFDVDEGDRDAVRARLLELVAEVGRRFRRERRWARTARLKLRDDRFVTWTRQRPLVPPACDDQTLRAAALALFEGEWPAGAAQRPLRLIGFGVANFTDSPAAEQLDLFAADPTTAREKRERLSRTLDALRDRNYRV